MAKFTISILFATLAAVALASPTPSKVFERNYPSEVCTECVSSPNNCDITAPCSNFLGSLYCGCRPGYRAEGYESQWRIDFPGHEHRVWVAPGVECNTLCDNPWGTDVCGEVSFQDQCLPETY